MPLPPAPSSRQVTQHNKNKRLGWVLASIALVFFLGIVIKIMFLR
ncbi:MAG: cytochrome oxidase small assembly protein [Burkholderiaceae bacterium]|jgi:hypothetical protein